MSQENKENNESKEKRSRFDIVVGDYESEEEDYTIGQMLKNAFESIAVLTVFDIIIKWIWRFIKSL